MLLFWASTPKRVVYTAPGDSGVGRILMLVAAYFASLIAVGIVWLA